MLAVVVLAAAAVRGEPSIRAGSGSQQPALTVQNPPSFSLNASTAADQGPLQSTSFTLSGPFQATYSAQTNSPVARRQGSNQFVGALPIDAEEFGAPASGTVALAAGNHCISFVSEDWSCATNNVGVVSCFTPTPLTWSYTVTLRPAP